MAEEFNFQIPSTGYDSYLDGIIPQDQAVLAGAFSTSMQQIKNIEKVDVTEFAKVVYSLETNNGLPLTNGTSVPTDQFLVDTALSKVALGTGLYGTFTHSDFIGSMTGLPYPLDNIYEGIKELQTIELDNIYREIWSITSYAIALAEPRYFFNGSTYTITGFDIMKTGGGYTTPPIVTITGSFGTDTSAIATIGTDIEDPATYKKVVSITLSSVLSSTTIPTVSISPPPNDSFGDMSPASWQLRNQALQVLIDRADEEIAAIQTRSEINFDRAKLLNANYNILGTALKIEHRSRYIALSPVPIPYDQWISQYPTALYLFADSVPEFSANTMPHGTAQSLENIADFCDVGGQSLIGLMRQERNQQRLAEIGIPLDNNVPDDLSQEDKNILMANGTSDGAVDGIPASDGEVYTLPSWPKLAECDGSRLDTDGNTFYDPNEESLRTSNSTIPGSIKPILDITADQVDDEVDDEVDDDFIIIIGVTIPIGESEILGTGIPNFITGETANVIPNNLNAGFISKNLLPSNYSIPDAIDKVIECNCDCWIN